MEISNRTFGLFCVAMVGVVIYVRAESVRPTVVVAAPPVAVAENETKRPTKKHGIPDSSVPPEMNPVGGMDDQPILVNGGVDPDQPVPLPMSAPTDAPAAPAATPPPTDAAPQDESLANQDDISDVVANLADQQQQANQMQITDRDVLRLMLSSLNGRQRQELEALWYTMSPDDRQDLIDQVRGTQQGN